MEFDRCNLCKQFHWANEKCKPEFFVILRDYWFDDEREINELTQDDYDALEWRKYHADDAAEAAEKYVEYLCHHGDGLVEEAIIYVKDSLDNITKHVVVSELVIETRSVKQEKIEMIIEMSL